MTDDGTTPESGGGSDSKSASSSSKGASRIVAVIVLSVLAVYAVRLTGRVLELERASLAEQRLEAEVGALEAEVEALETAAVSAGDDAFTERWAREERGWLREGDQPLSIVEATPTPPTAPVAEPANESDLLSRLKRWFSGSGDE